MLGDVIRRADTGINVGYAIVYECVRTVTTIYPNNNLLDEAARAIARFLGSENHNLKYLGITGLAQVVEQHPKYAAEHQLAVIDCLSSVDDTLKRKTLDLLYRMMNPVNVEFIASKLVESLEQSTDDFLRRALVSRLCTAAERIRPVERLVRGNDSKGHGARRRTRAQRGRAADAVVSGRGRRGGRRRRS